MLNCRKCPIRNRCIEEGVHASSVRMMLYHAFENKTDTLATWGRLNANCLIVKYKRDETKKLEAMVNGGGLSQRLEQAREQRKKQSPVEPTGRVARSNGFVGYEEVDPHRIDPEELPESLEKHFVTGLRPFSENKQADANIFWLTIEESWRHIVLPADGALVLGHFDPSIGVPPDVDLGYEDRNHRCISRRHASLVGKNGQHTIEDLGSVAGTFLNGERLGFGPSRPLNGGDRITVGQISMVYGRVPPVVQNVGSGDGARHNLMVAATGRKFRLTPNVPMIIGRSDARIDFMPDIDLLQFGPIAQRVSRRHAKLEWRNGVPHIEDMGSGFGTRLRGGLLPLGESKALLPGDHIWLAGFVLVYDIQVKKPPVAKPAPNGDSPSADSPLTYHFNG
ncbi:MAG: hypothetical protein FOGNACKC_01041 [Anaerolineae bacterium]|nr:hypothetical protein [Anaerolineae bacterium]